VNSNTRGMSRGWGAGAPALWSSPFHSEQSEVTQVQGAKSVLCNLQPMFPQLCSGRAQSRGPKGGGPTVSGPHPGTGLVKKKSFPVIGKVWSVCVWGGREDQWSVLID